MRACGTGRRLRAASEDMEKVFTDDGKVVEEPFMKWVPRCAGTAPARAGPRVVAAAPRLNGRGHALHSVWALRALGCVLYRYLCAPLSVGQWGPLPRCAQGCTVGRCGQRPTLCAGGLSGAVVARRRAADPSALGGWGRRIVPVPQRVRRKSKGKSASPRFAGPRSWCALRLDVRAPLSGARTGRTRALPRRRRAWARRWALARTWYVRSRTSWSEWSSAPHGAHGT